MHSEVPNRFNYCNMSFKYSKRQRNKTCESHSIHYRQMQCLYFTVETVFCACLCVLRQSLLMVSVQRLKHTLQSGSSERNECLRLGTGSSSSLCCLSASSSSSIKLHLAELQRTQLRQRPAHKHAFEVGQCLE